jgi:hypothetical protein
MKKWANELNRAFSKEELQMIKKTHEEMFNIPGHKKMQIKTTELENIILSEVSQVQKTKDCIFSLICRI